MFRGRVGASSSSTRCMTGLGSPTESPPMAIPVQGPRSRMPSSERRRRSAWVPPWMMGQSVWAGGREAGWRTSPRFRRPPSRPPPAPRAAPCTGPATAASAPSPPRPAPAGPGPAPRGRMPSRCRRRGPTGSPSPVRGSGSGRCRRCGSRTRRPPPSIRAQPLEREDLEPARVGEHRPVPGREACRPPSARTTSSPGRRWRW